MKKGKYLGAVTYSLQNRRFVETLTFAKASQELGYLSHFETFSALDVHYHGQYRWELQERARGDFEQGVQGCPISHEHFLSRAMRAFERQYPSLFHLACLQAEHIFYHLCQLQESCRWGLGRQIS
jgi:hypothetical protein